MPSIRALAYEIALYLSCVVIAMALLPDRAGRQRAPADVQPPRDRRTGRGCSFATDATASSQTVN